MAVLLHHGYSLTISPVKPSREKNGSEETAVSESRKDSGKNPQDFCTSQSWDAQEHFCSRTSTNSARMLNPEYPHSPVDCLIEEAPSWWQMITIGKDPQLFQIY